MWQKCLSPPLCVKTVCPPHMSKLFVPPLTCVWKMIVFGGQTKCLSPGGQTKRKWQPHTHTDTHSALYIQIVLHFMVTSHVECFRTVLPLFRWPSSYCLIHCRWKCFLLTGTIRYYIVLYDTVWYYMVPSHAELFLLQPPSKYPLLFYMQINNIVCKLKAVSVLFRIGVGINNQN